MGFDAVSERRGPRHLEALADVQSKMFLCVGEGQIG
jgi:hypothetical protein